MRFAFLSLLSFLSLAALPISARLESTQTVGDDGVQPTIGGDQLMQEDTANNERRLPDERIVGGSPSVPLKFPFYSRVDARGTFICGGTLIDRQFVLTAAHCATNAMSVSVGEYYNSDAGSSTGIYRSITGIYQHYLYNSRTNQHDLMLLRLSSPVDSILPVRYNTDRNEPDAGDTATLIGLGWTNPSEPSSPDVLHEIDLRVIDRATCTGQNNNYYQWAPSQVDDSTMFCAGDTPYETGCFGDSGGPILRLGPTPAEHVQIGLTSWGPEFCGQPGLPGVYARTSPVDIWIKNTICTKSDNPPDECYGSDGSIQCSNSPGSIYMGFLKGTQSCSWINGGLFPGWRRWWVCQPAHPAWQHCPDQCDSCA